METKIDKCRKGARGVKYGTAAAVGTFVAGVPMVTFATPPTPDETAGAAVTAVADRGEAFVTTYVIPGVVIALGATFVLTLLVKGVRRIRGAI